MTIQYAAVFVNVFVHVTIKPWVLQAVIKSKVGISMAQRKRGVSVSRMGHRKRGISDVLRIFELSLLGY